MKHIQYSLVFLLFCFAACKSPSFIEKKIVEFDTGFPLQAKNYGTWYDKKTKKEYIYFTYGLTDSAKIRFFTLNGQRQLEIEDIMLKSNNGLNGLVSINSIFVYDIDTIVILDNHYQNNKMVYLNRKGERIKKIDFTDSVFGIQAERYHMRHISNMTSHNPFVYLSCYWSWVNPRDSNLFHSSFKNKLEHEKMYFKMQYETPAVCRFDVQTSTITFTEANMIPKYFLPQENDSLIINASTLIISEMLSNCYDNKLFIWMRGKNRILVLNPDNLQIEHSFDVNSNYSSIGIAPIPLALRNQEFIEHRCKGNIIRILYDKKHNLYYVVAKHEIPEEDRYFYDGDFQTDAPFSIHIFNANFEKLNEQYFESGKYNYYCTFLTSQGLYIAQNENNKDYDPTKCRFYFFEIKQ